MFRRFLGAFAKEKPVTTHMPKLTKRTAESAKAREKDYFIWDNELPGLGLRRPCSP